jgi:flagellar basal-body rod modification protein FlgD
MDSISQTQPSTTTQSRAANQAERTATANTNVQAAVAELGSDVFLRLLVTQLQSQDPTNPVQNEEFVAQLAQFTTLEQTTSSNKLLKQLIDQDGQRTQLDLVNLIGRTVVSQGDTVSLGKEDQPTLAYALSGNAGKVTIDILDQNKQVVQSLDIQEIQKAGANQVQWDGLDRNGDRVPEGIYQFQVKAEDLKKNSVPVLTFAREPVTHILYGAEKPVVLQSGKALQKDDIISIQ